MCFTQDNAFERLSPWTRDHRSRSTTFEGDRGSAARPFVLVKLGHLRNGMTGLLDAPGG